jgi:uncharacterized protein YndB with AHSA1/START domain
VEVRFEVHTRIDRPVEEVFDHVVEPGLLCSYFTTAASGELAAGREVRWEWSPTESEAVRVEELEPNRRIVLTWRAYHVPTRTRVTFTFEPDGAGATVVRIAEAGWEPDQAGLDSAMEHCAGWEHMLQCLKARLRFGIDLRG